LPRQSRPLVQSELPKQLPAEPQKLVTEDGHEQQSVSEVAITTAADADKLDTTF
jgi:hypothetical protein